MDSSNPICDGSYTVSQGFSRLFIEMDFCKCDENKRRNTKYIYACPKKFWVDLNYSADTNYDRVQFMNRLKLVMIFLILLIFIQGITPLSIIPMSAVFSGQLNVLLTSILFIISFISIQPKSKVRTPIFLYLLVIIIHVFISENNYNYSISWLSPISIALAIITFNKRKNSSIKFLGYLFYVLFICNAIIAIYERVSGSYLFEINMEDEIMTYQMAYGQRDEYGFRSFALLGHPLTNANVMAIMTFILYFSNKLNEKQRLFFLFLGISSLICFNSRGALAFSGILLLPSIYLFFKENIRFRKWGIILFVLIFIFAYNTIDEWGGRLLYEGINDSSSYARLLTIKYFFDLSFHKMIIGGNVLQIGENGFFMILAEWGLILGGVKIICEIIIGWKFMPHYFSTIEKSIVMSTFFIIGNMNNNLAGPAVWSFFIYSLIFFNYEIYGKGFIRS